MKKPVKNSSKSNSEIVPPDLLVLNETQAARVLGISVQTLQRMRKGKGGRQGPKILQLSLRHIGYRRATLDAWLEAQEMASPNVLISS